MNNYPEIVNVIHKEFNTVTERIVKEANEILTQVPISLIEKGKRLAKLGFHRTKEANDAYQLEEKSRITKEMAELVKYYQKHYPLNKFVDETSVKQICEKYGLVCGEISMFKGFVPEIKLTQIENFKLRQEDVPYAVLVNSSKNEVLSFLCYDDINHSNYVDEEIKKKSYFFVNDNSGRLDDDSQRINHKFHPLIKMQHNICRVVHPEKYIGLKICAPIKDMEIPQGYQLQGHKIVHNPDPVVLQPVNGGYLIVAAWGDEASDEIVVNPINQ